jgi:hypothetical protein
VVDDFVVAKARCFADYSIDELLEDDVVDDLLVPFGGRTDLHGMLLEHLRIDRPAHGETGAEQCGMLVAAVHRGLRDFLDDVQPRNRRSRRDMFESEMGGIVRTDREMGTRFRNDLRFAEHEFGDGLIVAAIECRHPLAEGDAAERHLRMHVLTHEFLGVRGNLAKTERGTLGAARHDANMFGFDGLVRRHQSAVPFWAQLWQTIPEHRSVSPEIANTEYFHIAAAASQSRQPQGRPILQAP